jgi:hypothetical protein
VALQGTLDTFALPDVLRLLAATKKTGRLRITGGRGNGSVWVDGGGVAGLEAPHAPLATEPVDALFELLRFDEGSFTFDADVTHDGAPHPEDVETLLTGAEALLAEWREIESVVPSMDAFVTLRRTLASPEVSIDAASWTTVVAVGGGATVRRMAEDLCLAELPVSRTVRDLVVLGLADIAPAAPIARIEPTAPPADETLLETNVHATDAPVVDDDLDGAIAVDLDAAHEPLTPAPDAEPDAGHDAVDDPHPQAAPDEDAPLPIARPLRARRVKDHGRAETPEEDDVFVPLELPGHGPAGSYDPVDEDEDDEIREGEDALTEADDLAAAFPGLANRAADPTPEEEELARQLATLSPRAAEAVRAAAEAATDEEREAALDEVDGDEERPINRGLLLKFLSSVKS